jgi:hypothetical protein
MKHLADHRKPSTGTRLREFLRLAHDRSQSAWSIAWRKPARPGQTNRRAVEFARIERGRLA